MIQWYGPYGPSYCLARKAPYARGGGHLCPPPPWTNMYRPPKKGSDCTHSPWAPTPVTAPSGVFYEGAPLPLGPPNFYFIIFKIKSKHWEGVQGGVTELRRSSFRLLSTPALSVTPLWGAPLTQACHWAPREWVRRVRARRALGLGHWPRVPKGPYTHTAI